MGAAYLGRGVGPQDAGEGLKDELRAAHHLVSEGRAAGGGDGRRERIEENPACQERDCGN